mgnify:FL=1
MQIYNNEITIDNCTFKGKSFKWETKEEYDSLQHADIIDSIIYDWIEHISLELEDPEVLDKLQRKMLLFCLTYASESIRYL